MGFVYGAGGRTLPKAGILGGGAFYPAGHHPSLQGNVFGANWDKPEIRSEVNHQYNKDFGAPTPSLIMYNAGVARNNPTAMVFPLDTHFQRATYRKLSMLTHARADASGAYTGVEPTPGAQQVQLHELTTFVHGRVSHQRPPYRVSGGVNNSLPSDTAFQRRSAPKGAVRQKPQPQTAGDTSLYHGTKERLGTGISSFRVSSHMSGSGGQLWGDPNQSFIAGRKNAINGRIGLGRWQVVKRGAAE